MIVETIDRDEPIPQCNYVEVAEIMTSRGYPMTPQRARMIEQKALRKLAKQFPDLLHEAGLERD